MSPRITVHFHPGWNAGERMVIDALADGGVYLSQWVTRTSNGGLTAHPGGDRWRWESRIFEGRYDDASAEDRPLYGGWNRRDDPYGAAPRFGSAYLRMRADVVQRSTFCWPDSVFAPMSVAGADRLDELCRLADSGLVDHSLLLGSDHEASLDDPLNDYVEAHVHGGLVMSRDVEAIVVDPTDRAVHADALGRLGCHVEEHPGYRVSADMIDPAYRGDAPVQLARRLGGNVDPARLAAASRTGKYDPRAVKWLWHCLACFGRQNDTLFEVT